MQILLQPATIPNAMFARIPIVNFTVRDRMLLKAVIGLRCETTPAQLRYVVAAAGPGFAFPAQTLYFARDTGLDPDKSAAALAQVQQWRVEHKPPFPDFDVEFRKMYRDSLDYPPAGSSTAEPKRDDKSAGDSGNQVNPTQSTRAFRTVRAKLAKYESRQAGP
jgi:hypothetical protein